MTTIEPKDNDTTSKTAAEKLSCKGRACLTCGKCQDWHFNGDEAIWEWIGHYERWSNDDWKRWCRGRMWALFVRREGATCTSASHGPGSTYDDPVFGGHQVTHTVNFFAGFNIKASHDFLFVGDQIPADHRIVSSTGDLCVCHVDKK